MFQLCVTSARRITLDTFGRLPCNATRQFKFVSGIFVEPHLLYYKLFLSFFPDRPPSCPALHWQAYRAIVRIGLNERPAAKHKL